jgi:hypothetical protein
MAPFQGPSREALLKMLRGWRAESKLPITLGKYEPQAYVLREGDEWQIRLLEEDPQLVAEMQERQRKEGYLMPEHYFSCKRSGVVLIRADSRDAFIAAIEKMDWPFGPDEPRRRH